MFPAPHIQMLAIKIHVRNSGMLGQRRGLWRSFDSEFPQVRRNHVNGLRVNRIRS